MAEVVDAGRGQDGLGLSQPADAARAHGGRQLAASHSMLAASSLDPDCPLSESHAAAVGPSWSIMHYDEPNFAGGMLERNKQHRCVLQASVCTQYTHAACSLPASHRMVSRHAQRCPAAAAARAMQAPGSGTGPHAASRFPPLLPQPSAAAAACTGVAMPLLCHWPHVRCYSLLRFLRRRWDSSASGLPSTAFFRRPDPTMYPYATRCGLRQDCWRQGTILINRITVAQIACSCTWCYLAPALQQQTFGLGSSWHEGLAGLEFTCLSTAGIAELDLFNNEQRPLLQH